MNKIRIIKKEKTKQYLIKVLCAKILIGRGYDIYSEFDCLRNPAFNTQRIPKIYAINKKLKKRSKIFIEIENSITNSKKLELSKYYEECKAFVFPGEEDFGIVMVEAMVCGKPVIAFAGGGALEIIDDRQTGILFEEQTENGLIGALKEFEQTKGQYMPREIRDQALRFNDGVFKEKMYNAVKQALKENNG